ncbi:Small nuclear ribonucleoprotein Sm D3 [Aphanomyces cochlioides]|nr:Small nuclear ribonucleoprotein Sm D3 [Aphanomyces cochlioides]
MSKNLGVPLSLLHEGEGHSITLELKNGEIYRGHLVESEDSMNCQLKQVTLTSRDGQIHRLEQVYIRGSQVKLFILPDMLQKSPLFKKVQALKKPEEKKPKKGKGRGRGRGKPAAA